MIKCHIFIRNEGLGEEENGDEECTNQTINKERERKGMS